MIDDLASLKRAMKQMDAEDVAVAKAAKDRVAQILRDAGIKRTDQPDMPGDTAFHDAGRSEGPGDNSASKYEDPVERSEPLHQMVMEGEPDAPALPFVTRIVSFPLRRPLRFLVTAVVAFWLVNAFRFPGYFASIGAQADAAIALVSSFFDKRQPQEAATPPAPRTVIPPPSAPSATPSAAPATAPALPATAAASSANESAPSAAAPAGPPAPTPRLDARGAPPSKSAPKDHARVVPPRVFERVVPDGIRRDSEMAGPCIGGIGGCYWGGRQY